ncbi:hypothetical protein OJAV_G00230270 [Oryzias javanicus]|uniref:Uncharacterized protein n=1 Tax=Oryzias javanicus TaxID=123683 RepID=A0A3S2MC44_ORYJA|nr:hypothetical protein OJAV_G00230270 [Oryzias javanicus]
MDLIFAVLGLLALLVDSIRCQGVYGAQAAHQPGDRGSEFRPQVRQQSARSQSRSAPFLIQSISAHAGRAG